MTEKQRRKLIEVALPLDEINAACKADKDRKTGTIRNLHKWFAPMPLPAWRALLFAALVDDPGDDEQRATFLEVIKGLVASGADTPNQAVVEKAREIIRAQYPDGTPTVMDPFCGAGSTLLEAQRLGAPTAGSDLNPVPVLITRTLTELLPKVSGQQPLHQEAASAPRGRRASRLKDTGGGLAIPLIEAPTSGPRVYAGFGGLLRDLAYYAELVHDRAFKELEDAFPSLPGETPVAWLWVRTAACPNPTCRIPTPLTTSWWLLKREGRLAWIEPVVVDGVVDYKVKSGQREGAAPQPTRIGDGVFACVACQATLEPTYLRSEGAAHRIGNALACVVSENATERSFRAPTVQDLAAAACEPPDTPFVDVPINADGQGIRVGAYGIRQWTDLLTPRQLKTLVTFADLVSQIRDEVVADGGTETWADAVATMLTLALGKLVHVRSTQTRWKFDSRSGGATVEGIYAMPTLPMTWDFAESFPFESGAGSWRQAIALVGEATKFVVPDGTGTTQRADARTQQMPKRGLVATDPPYFEAIGYADLSDYYYIWHRHALQRVHPDLFTTIATPKSGELIASPSRHAGSGEAARQYFIDGFTETFRNLQRSMADDLPLIVVYASKEQKGGRGDETRWASILSSMMAADLEITGTWPIRGTGSSRLRTLGSNAVASYVAMVCRPRRTSAGACSLGDFNRALRRELRPAVHKLQAAGILPVDLPQSAMGPGMQVFSRYRQVLDQDGRAVPVEQALRLISAALGEVLDEQEGELDSYSRFAVGWFEKHGWDAAPFGDADEMVRPQGISVDDTVRAGVAHYPRPGFVQLRGDGPMSREWKPATDSRPSAWQAVHHLADRLIDGGGSLEAGRLMGELGVYREPAQALVYRLHDIAARKSRGKDQERYNALIGSWADLLAVAATGKDGLF